MFERYTEQARRAIFFARYEASQFGDTEIGDAHLLLGLTRESKNLFARSGGAATIESIRRRVEDAVGPPREAVSTSVDIPLSSTAKHVLAYAAEEAEGLGHKHIGTEHLLLGLLREKNCVAAIVLREEGFRAEELRRTLAADVMVEPPPLGGTAYARGVGVGSGSVRSGVLEFVCDGAVIASVVLFPGSPVPRQGEQILLKDKATNASFRVEEVSYIYDRFPPDMVVAPHRIAKVVIRVKRDGSPS
jgi:ATP-dependent Clp protease ATP-binding subunit ClpC